MELLYEIRYETQNFLLLEGSREDRKLNLTTGILFKVAFTNTDILRPNEHAQYRIHSCR